MRQRYSTVAPAYTALSAEWPVYRVGRLKGIPLLELSEGDSVLDVGCGTGLNFPLLLDAVGRSGQLLGVDISPDMLRTAQQKLGQPPPTNVHLVERDATHLNDLASKAVALLGRAPDGILFTYSLSLMVSSSTWRYLRARAGCWLHWRDCPAWPEARTSPRTLGRGWPRNVTTSRT